MKLEQSTKYCNEDISLIENYNDAMNDDSCRYVIHHRLETHTSDGERRLVDITAKELKALGMYYHRPANELIIMKNADHCKLHIENKSAGFTKEQRERAAKTRGLKSLVKQTRIEQIINENPNLSLRKVAKEYENIYNEKIAPTTVRRFLEHLRESNPDFGKLN